MQVVTAPASPEGQPAARPHACSRTKRSTSRMRPVSSATSMKSPRRHAPALGVVPAHERLGGGHVARGQLDDRLQLDDQLAALGRALEVLLEAVAAQDGGVHRRLEDLVALLAGVLGGVHRDVGVAQQLLGALRVGGPALDDPEARVREISWPATVKGRSSSRDDAVGDAGHGGAVLDVVQEHGELVAAQARREVAGLAARRAGAPRPPRAARRRPSGPSESLTVLKSSRSRKRTV